MCKIRILKMRITKSLKFKNLYLFKDFECLGWPARGAGPVRSGPVRPVRSSALGPRARTGQTGRTDRTGPDRANLDLASARCRPCPVRSGPSGPLQCPGPKAPGPDRPDGPDRTGQGRVGIFSSPGIHIHSHIYIYTSTWHLPIGARDGHIITLSNVINANCSSKAELKLFAGRGTKGLLCHIYVYIYICICVFQNT